MLHSLYLHIPFCRHRCAYCDFNTYAGQEQAHPGVRDRAVRGGDVRRSPRPRRSGAAHDLLWGRHPFAAISSTDRRNSCIPFTTAFTVTPRSRDHAGGQPRHSDFGGLQALRQAGINRLSLGVQSANGEELRLLERQHSYRDVLDAVLAARRAGFRESQCGFDLWSARADAGDVADHRAAHPRSAARARLGVRAHAGARHALWDLGATRAARHCQIPTWPPTCTNGHRLSSRPPAMSNTRSRIGQDQAASAATICNTGGDCRILGWGPAHMAIRAATGIRTCWAYGAMSGA